jgi:thiamine biosynthesis protein ThiS
MTITVNGKKQGCTPGITVQGLLHHLNLDIARVAVELNSDILPRDLLANTPLQDGDKLEIVQFVGGG